MHLFFYQQSMAPLLKKMINYIHGNLLVFVDIAGDNVSESCIWRLLLNDEAFIVSLREDGKGLLNFVYEHLNVAFRVFGEFNAPFSILACYFPGI